MKYSENNIIGVQFYAHRRNVIFTIERSESNFRDDVKISWTSSNGQKEYSWYYKSDVVHRLNQGTWTPINPIKDNYEYFKL